MGTRSPPKSSMIARTIEPATVMSPLSCEVRTIWSLRSNASRERPLPLLLPLPLLPVAFLEEKALDVLAMSMMGSVSSMAASPNKQTTKQPSKSMTTTRSIENDREMG